MPMYRDKDVARGKANPLFKPLVDRGLSARAANTILWQAENAWFLDVPLDPLERDWMKHVPPQQWLRVPECGIRTMQEIIGYTHRE